MAVPAGVAKRFWQKTYSEISDIGFRGIFIDYYELSVCKVGKKLNVFLCKGCGNHCVVGSTGLQPSCGADLEVGLMPVHDLGNGKLRHGLGNLNELNVCADDPEVVTEIDKGNLNAVSDDAVKNKPGGIILTADAKGMYLDLRLCTGKGSRNLQHMGSKLQFGPFCQIIGVILYEACGAFTSFGHLHENCGESGDLVVAFRSETGSFSHQVLDGDTGKLLHVVEILEGIGKGFAAVLFKESLKGDLVLCLLTDSFGVVGVQ